LAATASGTALPKPPARPDPGPGIAAGPLGRRIDEFLSSRGYTTPGKSPAAPVTPSSEVLQPATPAKAADTPAPLAKPLDFVCEDDVRQAMRQGRKLLIGERTIVTPAARDLAEQHHLLVTAEWPRQGF
jgi:hypothetical protein